MSYAAVVMKAPVRHRPASLKEPSALVASPYVRYNVHMKKIMTATEARKDFFSVLKAAGKPGRTITITLGGEPPVIMMSAEEFEGWVETLEIMSDPELVRQLDKAKTESETITLDELMEEFGYPKKHVSRRVQNVGRKTASRSTRKAAGKGVRRAAVHKR